MSLLRPSEFVPWRVMGKPISNALCHYRENLFFIGEPGVARYGDPPLTFWGHFEWPHESKIHREASAVLRLGDRLEMGIMLWPQDSGKGVLFLDLRTYSVVLDLRDIPEEHRRPWWGWPPPPLPLPDPKWSYVVPRLHSYAAQGASMSLDALRKMLEQNWPRETARPRFTSEGGIRG